MESSSCAAGAGEDAGVTMEPSILAIEWIHDEQHAHRYSSLYIPDESTGADSSKHF